ARAQSPEHELRRRAQRLEYPLSHEGIGGKARHPAEIERGVEFVGRVDELPRQVLLVVLQDEREGARVNSLLGEDLMQVAQALEILVELSALRVGDEDDAIGA